MIILIIILFVFGLLAILAEAVLPMGIAATAGVAAILFSAYLAYDQYGLKLAIIYCLIAAGIATVVVRFAVHSGLELMTLSPPGAAGKKKAGAGAAAGTASGAAPSEEETFPRIGDMATVVQPLRPTGTIEWEGQRLSARASLPEREYKAGTRVQIDGKDSIFWTVGDAREEAEAEAATEDPGSAEAS